MASSFPRRRESRSVGTETYRENSFLRFCVLDSRFRGNDGIKVSKFILNN
ncbi:pilus assembly protein PilS [Neisseria meningitidis]|nr:pilus assembly protein PilS [Neisseria meningitidis]PKT93306.1 pilus assembly protein PilS [Neisseria meningitidis]PKT96917.1 pilus assembly protein PilS [Neisseria meningitidis]